MQVQQATAAQLAQLERYSFLDVNIQASLTEHEELTLEMLATRAWWVYFSTDEISNDFDGWIDYAESRDWDPELIDMHLSCC